MTYKGTSIKLSVDCSAEPLQVQRKWDDIFKMLKGKNYQPRIFYPAKLSFKTRKQQTNPKLGRKKEITKIRAEINEIETRKTIENIDKTVGWFLKTQTFS